MILKVMKFITDYLIHVKFNINKKFLIKS
jgi:hypothetical protein